MNILTDWRFWAGWLAIDAAFVLFIWWALGDLRESLDLWAYKHVRWYRRRIIRRALVAWVTR